MEYKNLYNRPMELRGNPSFKKEIKKEVKKVEKKETKKSEGKLGFKKRKENTFGSLKEVEKFLCNSKKLWKGFKIYKLFKY